MNENWRDAIDFCCSRLWREYYAETLEGVDLPSIYPEPVEIPEPKETRIIVKHHYIYPTKKKDKFTTYE